MPDLNLYKVVLKDGATLRYQAEDMCFVNAETFRLPPVDGASDVLYVNVNNVATVEVIENGA